MTQPNTDLTSLTDGIAALTRDISSVEHTGRHNRLSNRRERLISALVDHEARDAGFALLLRHKDAAVRKIGGFAKKLSEAKETASVDPAPARYKVFPFEPLPPECSRTQVEALIRNAFPVERSTAIGALLRPSIRPWPQPSSNDALASRFGGIPAVPSDWAWPHESKEPLLFLAQIDCVQVHATTGASKLPASGMLSFFGDHDDVTGCFPSGGGKVFYFSDIARLRLAAPPLDDFEPLITCGLDFYSHFELPDPKSTAIAALELTKDERESYLRLHKSITMFGYSQPRWTTDISKLLGWPDLVQSDLGSDIFSSRNPEAGASLLFQIGAYRDGTDLEGWRPGGLLYFTLNWADLAARHFGNAELEVQST
jgi:hypothetical protein